MDQVTVRIQVRRIGVTVLALLQPVPSPPRSSSDLRDILANF